MSLFALDFLSCGAMPIAVAPGLARTDRGFPPRVESGCAALAFDSAPETCALHFEVRKG